MNKMNNILDQTPNWEEINEQWHLIFIMFVYIIIIICLSMLFYLIHFTDFFNGMQVISGFLYIITIIFLVILNILFPIYIYLTFKEYQFINGMWWKPIEVNFSTPIRTLIEQIIKDLNMDVIKIINDNELYHSFIPNYLRKINYIYELSNGLSLVLYKGETYNKHKRISCCVGPPVENNRNLMLDLITRINKIN